MNRYGEYYIGGNTLDLTRVVHGFKKNSSEYPSRYFEFGTYIKLFDLEFAHIRLPHLVYVRHTSEMHFNL